MRPSTYILYTLVALFGLCHIGLTTPVAKRQILDNPNYIDPAEQDLETQEEQDRGKRKIEGAVELTYGAKNAVLGLLFNKINSFIDQKTAWVNNLDSTVNVAKNKQYGIEPPKDPITSFGDIFGSHTYKWILNKPKFFKFPSLPIPRLAPVAPVGHEDGGRYRRAVGVAVSAGAQRRQGKAVETTTEDLVMFTPGQKVSLEVPDQLFGSGFTLITNISQIVGNLIQNSAERTARIFESMKPFLQSVFGVRSLTVTRDGPKDNAV